MAVIFRTNGVAIYGTANLTPVIPDSQAVGEMMICFYGTKPYSDVPTIDQGWTSLGYATDGTILPTAADVGSMQARIFYKIATADPETNPTITNSTNNVSTAIIVVFGKEAGDTWLTPVGAGNGDATAGTDFSVTVSSDVGHTTGDMVVGFACFRSDAATPTTARSITIPGCTLGSYVQIPVPDPETTSGYDMGLSGGCVLVNSGTSSAPPVFAATLAAGHTGSAYLVRLRVTGVTVVEGSANGSGNGLASSIPLLYVLGTSGASGVGLAVSLAILDILAQVSGQGTGLATADGEAITPFIEIIASGSGAGLGSSLGILDIFAQVTGSGNGLSTGTAYLVIPANVLGSGIGESSTDGYLLIPASASASGVGLAEAVAQLTALAQVLGSGLGGSETDSYIIIPALASGEGIGESTLQGLLEILASALASGIGLGSALGDVWVAPIIEGMGLGSGIGTGIADAWLVIPNQAEGSGIGSGQSQPYLIISANPIGSGIGEGLTDSIVGDNSLFVAAGVFPIFGGSHIIEVIGEE